MGRATRTQKAALVFLAFCMWKRLVLRLGFHLAISRFSSSYHPTPKICAVDAFPLLFVVSLYISPESPFSESL